MSQDLKMKGGRWSVCLTHDRVSTRLTILAFRVSSFDVLRSPVARYNRDGLSEQSRDLTIPWARLELEHFEGLKPLEIFVYVVDIPFQEFGELANRPEVFVRKEIDEFETLRTEYRQGLVRDWN